MLENGSRQFVWATIAQLEELEEETEEIEAWENPYTWLYNYNEEINKLIREREKSEREYTRALEDETTSAKELLDISKK
jgi:hypothetical protein